MGSLQGDPRVFQSPEHILCLRGKVGQTLKIDDDDVCLCVDGWIGGVESAPGL